MKVFKENKIIGLIIVFIVFGASIFIYRYEKDEVFKDEYMKEIFVTEESDKKDMSLDSNKIEEEAVVNKIVVEIKGEVNKPDVYTMDEDSIIRDLINEAEGVTEEANLDGINRAKKLQNNQLIVIPNINDKESMVVNNEYIEEEENELISINNASKERLMDIQGIGEVKADSIIEYREKNGGFKSIEELKNIGGIGEKTFEKLKDSISL